MLKFFLFLISPIFLMACGSSGQEDGPIIDLSIFKGLESEPILTDMKSLEHGSFVQINSVLEGHVLEGETVQYYFEPLDSELVVFIINQPFKAMALEVKSIEDGVDESLGGFYSSPIKIVDVSAGGRYLISISAGTSLGYFNLKVVQANRSSLSLSKDEYVFKESFTDYQKCGDGEVVVAREFYSLIDLSFNYGTQMPIGTYGVHYATNMYGASTPENIYVNSEHWIEIDDETGTLIGGGEYIIQIFDEDGYLLENGGCDGYIETSGEIIL